MSKILTSNVVISKNKQAFDNLFRQDQIDFESIDSNKFLVSPKKNKYLTSLEYEVNYSSKTHGFLNLVFADIDGKFEQEYLEPSRDVMSQIIEKSIDSRNWQNVNANALKNLCRDSIYVSFGTGNNSRNWSEPALFELYNAFVEVDDGFRYYKLCYIPINNPLFMKDLMIDVHESNPEKEKIEFENATHLLNLNVEVGDEDSFEKILEKYYKEYLKRLCNTENVVVMIPEGIDAYITGRESEKQKQRNLFSEYFFIDLARPKNSKPDPANANQRTAEKSQPNANVPRIEEDTVDRSTEGSLIATFNLTKIKNNNPLNILSINIFEPINSLSFGVQTCLKISDTVSVRTDNGITMLSKLKEFGVIPDPEKGRCVILGIDKQINEILYQNYFNIKKSSQPVIKLSNDSELKNKIEKEAFAEAIRNIRKKKKHSSGFEESLNLDELSIDARGIGQSRSKAIDPLVDKLSQLVKDYEETDTPVFLHNFKNSNILSINLENKNNTYLNALNFAVEEDFYSKLIDQIESQTALKNKEEYKFIEKNCEKIIDTVTEVVNSTKSNKPEFKPGSLSENVYKQMVANQQDLNNLNDILLHTLTYLFSTENSSNNVSSETTTSFFKDIASYAYYILVLLQHKKYLISIQSLAGRDTSDFRRAAIFKRLYLIGSPQIKIKTLPYFHLADYSVVGSKYSILFSKKTLAKISPYNDSLNDLINYLDFYSGLYCILGFKHTITPNGAYSEFKLQKRYLEVM